MMICYECVSGVRKKGSVPVMVVLLKIVLVPIYTGEQPRILLLLLGRRGDEVAHIALHHPH